MNSPPKTDGLLTPQPRGRKVYPTALAADDKARHVPLHRRGRSKTYERLEDLLREAGYKETRIFTPEAERLGENAEARARNGKDTERRALSSVVGTGRAFGGAMANLIGGFVRRGEDAQESPTTSKGGLQAGRGSGGLTGGVERNLSHSPSPSIQHNRRPLASLYPRGYNSPDSSGVVSSSSSRSPPASMRRRGGDARTSLRHMISAPDIPRRKQLLLPSRRKSERPYSEIPTDGQPPLPSNWLQTVTNAVLGAGSSSGAYIGGPSGNQSQSLRGRIARTPQHAPRASLTKSASGKRSFTPHTPRAGTSPGVVSTVSVVCRSTPGSRCSSVCRPAKPGKESQSTVPSLGATTVEGDVWPILTLPTTPAIRVDSAIHLDTDSESDDEGDITFARLILPSKRQHSIQSLRKHLHEASSSTARPQSKSIRPTPSTSNSVRRVLRTPTTPLADESFEDDLLQDAWHQNGTESTDDTADEWSEHSDLPGFARNTKKRGSLPWAPWAQHK